MTLYELYENIQKGLYQDFQMLDDEDLVVMVTYKSGYSVLFKIDRDTDRISVVLNK